MGGKKWWKNLSIVKKIRAEDITKAFSYETKIYSVLLVGVEILKKHV